MKRIKKLFVLGVTVVMSLAFTTGVLADPNETDVEVTINGGGLSLDIPKLDPINDITLTEDRESYATGFVGDFIIKDLQGTQEGWELSASADPLTEIDSGYKLPGGSLTLKPVDSIEQINYQNSVGDVPDIQTDEKNLDDGAVIVATAKKGTGMGAFELSFEDDNALGLHFDAIHTKEGTYESTITWNLVTAP